MSKITSLIKMAEGKSRCTKLYCTTCGALDFRGELQKLSNEEILEDLRALPLDFCDRNSDVLRLIFVEIAMFPTCADLREPLKDSPAGAVLESAISHSKYLSKQRLEHKQWSTPEATKERAIERKRMKATAHNLRVSKKAASDKTLKVFQDALSQDDLSSIFAELSKVEDALTGRAIGGFAYSVLDKRLRNGHLDPEQAMLLERYATTFGGHWEKLRQSHSPRKNFRGSSD